MNKKEKIINTAIKLFIKQGFENTPTSQISEEAKVATGTLFHHFKTKEELINSAYLYAKRKAIEDTSKAYSNGENVKERLKKAWNITLEWGYNNKNYMDFMFQFSNSVYISKLTKKEGSLVAEPFTEILDKGVKKNLFKNLPREILHETYFNIYRSFLHCMRTKNTFDKSLVSKGFKVLWDALEK